MTVQHNLISRTVGDFGIDWMAHVKYISSTNQILQRGFYPLIRVSD